MKKNQKNGFVLGILMTGLLFSCTKNEEVGTPISEETTNISTERGKLCGYVDGYWSITSVLSPSIGTQADTDFMYNQNTKIASVWGQNSVPLSFVKDNVNPNSTFNAFSYSNEVFGGFVLRPARIYFGEALFNAAKAKNPNNIVNAFVLAHEFAHQLQFNFNLPSVTENTSRALELEADAMGGYYLRRPNGFNAPTFASVATAYEFAALLGDNNVNSPSHHGTAPQRRSALRIGHVLGASVLTPQQFDTAFFRVYNTALNGTARQLELNPIEGLSKSENDYVLSHIDEIKRIQSGQMSDEEYFNLK